MYKTKNIEIVNNNEKAMIFLCEKNIMEGQITHDQF